MRPLVIMLSAGALLLGVAALPMVGQAAGDAAGLVKKRVDLMKGNGKHLKDFVDYTKGAPYSENLVADAKAVSAVAKQIPSLFPPGSVTADSRAKPEIWSKRSEFEAKAKTLQEAADKLALVAAKDDKAAIGAQLKQVGQACGGCHDDFRKPKE